MSPDPMPPPDPTKLAPPQVIEPIHVAIIGTGTGDGGAPIKSGEVVTTPDHQPNIVVQVVTPVVAITIRFLNLFVLTLLGSLSIKMAPASDNMIIHAIQAADFYALVVAGSSVALSSALYGLIKDISTILTGLEKTHPLATGSI